MHFKSLSFNIFIISSVFEEKKLFCEHYLINFFRVFFCGRFSLSMLPGEKKRQRLITSE